VPESKTPVEAYLAVGSNIEPERNILEALERLRQQVSVTGISTFYRTEPLGRPQQPDFLNGVWRIRTSVEPRELKFEVLRPIERALGRVRTADKYAARTIDLDILLYGRAVIDEPGLVIPDPGLRGRPFLALALLELAPRLVLPDTGEALRESQCVQTATGLRPEVEFTEILRDGLKS